MVETLLPPNATTSERALEASTARIDAVPVLVDQLWNPETCPAAFLPWLAWGLSVDVWNPDWPEAIKRRVIAASVEVHRRKGTVGAVRRAVQALGVHSEIRQWYEMDPPGPRHTMSVVVRSDGISGAVLDDAMLRDMRAAIDAAKATRTHYSFHAGADLGSRLGMAAAANASQRLSATLGAPLGLQGGMALAAAADPCFFVTARMTAQ